MTPKPLGPLHEMTLTTPTEYWNDSCSVQELTYAIERGAVGATTNPTIVLGVLKKEMPLWKERIQAMIRDNPTAAEQFLTWKLVEEMDQQSVDTLRKNGMDVLEVDKAFRKELDQVGVKLREDWAKKAGPEVQKVLDEFYKQAGRN